MHARKTIINFGGIELEVYQLPKGDYCFGQTQVGKSIQKGHTSVIQFLNTTSPFALPHKSFLDEPNYAPIVQDESFPFNLNIKPIPFKITLAYWTYWACKGNTSAQALLAAGTEETLTRLADQAFGVVKTEQQYQVDTQQSMEVYSQLLPMMQTLLSEMQEIKQELLILRPAYEELQELNKAFEEIRGLKPLLEEIAKVIDKPNQKKDTVRNWLKFLGLDNAVSPRQCQAIGRLIADWLKLGGMENYIQTSKPAKYSEAFVPLVKFAAEYQLFHAN